MEMPADSKEFMAVEKALLQEEGYADDDWDLSDGTQKAYKAAKLKRWNLDKIRVHFCTVTTDKKWQESVEASKQSSKGSVDQLSTVMDTIGRRDPEPSSGSKEEPSQGRRVSGQACHVLLLGSNFVFNYFFCILVSLGSVEKDMSKITGVAARLQTRQDPALKQKAKELSAFLKDQAQYMEQATQYLGAGEEARKGEINEAYLQVLQNHSDKMGELHAAVKDKLRRATALL